MATLHIRSISLPSTSHPLDASIEDHLQRMRSSQADPSTSLSICQNLAGIKDLYQSLNDLISFPQNQKNLCRGDVEEVLEGSIMSLDSTSSVLDVLSSMKDIILALQSSLRRGNSNEGIETYLMSRKKISKNVAKHLVHLNKTAKNCSSLENNDFNLKMLKEAEAITLSTLKSVLSFIMRKKAPCKTLGWAMVTKLVNYKHMPCESGNVSEVEVLDRALHSLSEKNFSAETKASLKKIQTLEAVIHELEDCLESLSRCLVKTRVSLLNVLTN